MAEQNSIRCIQLPLADRQLLLPNTVVAEVIGYAPPSQKGTDWLDGLLSWRGVMVPIISIEKMCQHNYVEPGSRTRIAIIYNLFNEDAMPYVGIILQDIPRGYLAEEDRMLQFVEDSDCEYLHGQLDAMAQGLMVPDLDAIMTAVKQKVSGGFQL
jgi:chemosensory pili system protein ChpC